jgi:hypothetical protein
MRESSANDSSMMGRLRHARGKIRCLHPGANSSRLTAGRNTPRKARLAVSFSLTNRRQTDSRFFPWEWFGSALPIPSRPTLRRPFEKLSRCVLAVRYDGEAWLRPKRRGSLNKRHNRCK